MRVSKNKAELSEIKRRHWKAHLQAWKKSGLSQVEYCKQHELNKGQFWYWKGKLLSSKNNTVNFVPVLVDPLQKKIKEQNTDHSGVVLFLRGDIRVELDNDFNSNVLKNVVALIGG